jgi:hypothetical protein
LIYTNPKVFISYSQESTEHSDRVMALANRLRCHGVDCWIDRFEPYPPQGWPMWMERQINQADFVLLVCTDRYLKRFNGQETVGVGKGVIWESALIRNHLYYQGHDNRKFIPVGFENGFDRFVPDRLRGVSRYLLDEFTFQSSEYTALYRRITGQDENVTPVGEIVKLSPLQPKDCVATIAGIRQASHLLLRSLVSDNRAAPYRFESTYAMRYLGFDSRRRHIDRFITENEFWMFSKIDANVVTVVKEDFMARSYSLKSSDRVSFVLWIVDPEATEREIKNDSQTPTISVEGLEGLKRFFDDNGLYSRESTLSRFAVLRHVLFDESAAPSFRIASKVADILKHRFASSLPATHAIFWDV